MFLYFKKGSVVLMDDKKYNIENNEQRIDTEVSNQKKDDYVDIFSNEPDKQQGNQTVVDNMNNSDIDNSDDYLVNNTTDNEKNNYQYYQFSNTSESKSLDEIREEEKAERLRQKLLRKQQYGSNNFNSNGGFTFKKFLAMTGLAVFLGVMAGLSFFITGQIVLNPYQNRLKITKRLQVKILKKEK